MLFVIDRKAKISNYIMYFLLLIFTILYIVVNKPTKEVEFTTVQTIYVILSFALIVFGCVGNYFNAKWATGIVLFILLFNLLLTGTSGLESIGLASDWTFVYLILPGLFFVVISFIDVPKLNVAKTIGICIMAIVLIYLCISSYGPVLDLKKELIKVKEEHPNGYWGPIQYDKEMSAINKSLSYYFFNILILVNLIISTILLKKENK